jgi:hypothetical protein
VFSPRRIYLLVQLPFGGLWSFLGLGRRWRGDALALAAGARASLLVRLRKRSDSVGSFQINKITNSVRLGPRASPSEEEEGEFCRILGPISGPIAPEPFILGSPPAGIVLPRGLPTPPLPIFIIGPVGFPDPCPPAGPPVGPIPGMPDITPFCIPASPSGVQSLRLGAVEALLPVAPDMPPAPPPPLPPAPPAPPAAPAPPAPPAPAAPPAIPGGMPPMPPLLALVSPKAMSLTSAWTLSRISKGAPSCDGAVLNKITWLMRLMTGPSASCSC